MAGEVINSEMLGEITKCMYQIQMNLHRKGREHVALKFAKRLQALFLDEEYLEPTGELLVYYHETEAERDERYRREAEERHRAVVERIEAKGFTEDMLP